MAEADELSDASGRGGADLDRTHAQGCPATVPERVNAIADMMATLEWDGRKSIRKLSDAWGLAESTIRNYSCEASRLVTGDTEEARRDITAGCRKLFTDAVREGDAKGARMVGELWAQVSGAKAPEKHQVGPLEEATPAKAREVMAGLFGQVTPDADQPGGGTDSSEAPEGSPES